MRAEYGMVGMNGLTTRPGAHQPSSLTPSFPRGIIRLRDWNHLQTAITAVTLLQSFRNQPGGSLHNLQPTPTAPCPGTQLPLNIFLLFVVVVFVLFCVFVCFVLGGTQATTKTTTTIASYAHGALRCCRNLTDIVDQPISTHRQDSSAHLPAADSFSAYLN